MKIARVGVEGHEVPAILEGGEFILLGDVIADWSRHELENGALEKVKDVDFSQLPRISRKSIRLGAPISQPSKIVCVGLNYIGHIRETNAEVPEEPITFMKSPDTLIGPNDDVVIPPNSRATDYEIELAIIIGERTLYLESPEDAPKKILGFTASQDVSERHWQLERNGQWMKGKSFPTFNPIGPVVVTPDQLDVEDVRLWCSVNTEIRQDDSTKGLLFGVNHLVWYISQFMELFPGDVINTGTPFGVGLGFKPPKYLKRGDVIESGIDGIGELRNKCI